MTEPVSPTRRNLFTAQTSNYERKKQTWRKDRRVTSFYNYNRCVSAWLHHSVTQLQHFRVRMARKSHFTLKRNYLITMTVLK